MKRFSFDRKNDNDGVNREAEPPRIDVNINGLSSGVKVVSKPAWPKRT